MRLRCICELVLAKLNTKELSVSLRARATSSAVGAVSVASCVHRDVPRDWLPLPPASCLSGSASPAGPGRAEGTFQQPGAHTLLLRMSADHASYHSCCKGHPAGHTSGFCACIHSSAPARWRGGCPCRSSHPCRHTQDPKQAAPAGRAAGPPGTRPAPRSRRRPGTGPGGPPACRSRRSRCTPGPARS